MRWLGQRGGWQVYDWAYIEGDGVVCIFDVCDDGLAYRLPTGDGRYIFFSDDCDLWLPTSDDVLEMLDLGHIEIWGPSRTQSGWVIIFDKVQGRQYEGRTYLIALLELLKVVEGKGDGLLKRND